MDGTAPSPLASKTSTLLLRYTEKILGTRGEFRSHYSSLIGRVPPHSVSLAKFFEKYAAFERYFQSTNFCSHSALSADNNFQTPTAPTLLIVRHLSMKTRNSFPWLGTHLLILLIIVLVFVSLSSRYMSRSGNILPDTASQTAHRGFLRIVWWTSTVPPRVLMLAKHSCYLSTLQAHYSFIFYGAS